MSTSTNAGELGGHKAGSDKVDSEKTGAAQWLSYVPGLLLPAVVGIAGTYAQAGLRGTDMAIATTVILLAGKAFELSGELSTLLAVGTSIRGVSAIIAGKGAIDADDEESGYAIAAILALGAVAL